MLLPGIDRRRFLRQAGLTLTCAALTTAQSKRHLRIGHTGITWGFKPDDAETAIPEVGSLGIRATRRSAKYLDAWELKGGLKPHPRRRHLPLISAYCNVNLTDPAKRADEISKIVRWAKLIQKCGGVTAVIGPNGVRRVILRFQGRARRT